MNHPSDCLVCNVKQPTGRLENWTYKDGDVIIWGEIYDDVHRRWREGEVIHTSEIIHLDIENGHVKTRNSLYILGKRKQSYGANA